MTMNIFLLPSFSLGKGLLYSKNLIMKGYCRKIINVSSSTLSSSDPTQFPMDLTAFRDALSRRTLMFS